MQLRWFINAALVLYLVLCGCGTEEGGRSMRTPAFIVDTVLSGYSIRLSMDSAKLTPGRTNDVHLEVDSQLGSDWILYSLAKEAEVELDSTRTVLKVKPSGKYDSASIHFKFRHEGNYGPTDDWITIPVH